MSIEQTKAVLDAYLGDEGMERVAEDAVYTMNGGRTARGREEIRDMLDEVYQRASHGQARALSQLFGDGRAACEYEFSGKHIGEFEGIPASGKEVRLTFCVVYEVGGEQITAARIYFPVDVVRHQVEA